MFFWIEAFILASSLLGKPSVDLLPADFVDTEKNSIRIYNGFESRPLMGFVLLGDIRREYHHTSISGIDLSRKLKSNVMDKPIDLSLRMSFVRYNENNHQRNHNQYNVFLKAHYKKRYKIIVVSSAMSGVTNDLIKKSKEISENFLPSEYDVLVSSGEQVACSLIAAR